MKMDDAAWQRHASPWSVYSRFIILPLFALAVWSRVWLGWWCLFPVALVALWTWVNPRLFAAPARLDSWASQAVMGERIFLNRKADPVPEHHRRMAVILTWASTIGVAVLAYGLWSLDLWAVISGLFGAMMPKIWFCDRMVWLYRERHGG
ncbi:hypothetical protein KHP62_17785 [Rhodobacteraceae bacterium NNCM2]|nr:hypothetical protein [Coraliihabitans acroporae]